jgi:hypothetical protein
MPTSSPFYPDWARSRRRHMTANGLPVVIPDGSQSDPIRDPSPTESSIRSADAPDRNTGVHRSRRSRLAALGRDDDRQMMAFSIRRAMS